MAEDPAASAAPCRADLLQMFEIYRNYCVHENELINMRTTWFIAFQSVLIATFGLTFQKYFEVSEKIEESGLASRIGHGMSQLDRYFLGFLVIVSVIGAALSFLSSMSVKLARDSLLSLEQHWDQHFGPHARGLNMPRLTRGFHEPVSAWRSYLTIILPLVLLVIWLVIFFFMILLSFDIDIGLHTTSVAHPLPGSS